MLERQTHGTTRAEEVAQIEHDLLELYRDPDLAEKPQLLERRGGAFYSEAAAQLVASLASGTGDVQVVNARNAGAIPNLGDDDVVEVAARVDTDGAHPIPVAPLGQDMLGLVQHAKAYERLTIEAATTGDRSTALRALLANPLVPDADAATGLLDAILDANREHLPRSRDERLGAGAPSGRPDRRDEQGDAPRLDPGAVAGGGGAGLVAGRSAAAVRGAPALGARAQRVAHGGVLRRARGLDRAAREDHDGAAAVVETARGGGVGDLRGHRGAGRGDAGGRRAADPDREPADRRGRDRLGGGRPPRRGERARVLRGFRTRGRAARGRPAGGGLAATAAGAGGARSRRRSHRVPGDARRPSPSRDASRAPRTSRSPAWRGYEGTVAHDREPASLERVRRYLGDLRALGATARGGGSPVPERRS